MDTVAARIDARGFGYLLRIHRPGNFERQTQRQHVRDFLLAYTVRLLQQKAVEKGCEYIYGAQGLTLVHENGKVTGAIFTDIDGKYFQVNADAVIVAAGDFGGNPDMRLDLCDTLRNLAWSYGKDRTDVNNISSMGRDGSGIRMMLWAGATMEQAPVQVRQPASTAARPSPSAASGPSSAMTASVSSTRPSPATAPWATWI